MMAGRQTATLFLVLMGLLIGGLTGCGIGSSGLGSADAALKDGEYETALSQIERVLEEDSSNTEALLLRADVFRQMADSTTPFDEYKDLHGRARAAEDRALSFDPELRQKVQSRRKRVFDREMDAGKLAYNRANKREEQDGYRRAIASFGAAGATQADSARPVLNEAFSRLRIGQQEPVIPVLEEYMERADTTSGKAYKILGKLYVNNEQYMEAAELLNRAVRTYPSDKDLHGLRLTAYNRAGNVDQALEVYRKQIEEIPDNVRYRYNYGALLLTGERYGSAIDQFKRAIEIKPDHMGSQYNLGAAYMNAALARDDSIAALEETSAAPSDSVEQQIEILVQKRDSLFKKSIPPLERVRQMEEVSDTIQRDACRALMVVYVQTNQPGRAAQAEKCTGFAQADL